MNDHNAESPNTIVLAGATGNLGSQIAQSLLEQGATVRALVRPRSAHKLAALQQQGVSVVKAEADDIAALTSACEGASCVVSALSGLRPVIVDAQVALLQAAVAAGVPRFIPSDFAADFTQLAYGTNRNFDLRRIFLERLEQTPIAATSVLNGMFADLLTGDAPLVLFPLRRILYWGDPDQPLDFTTIADTARYTAAAALDDTTPRFLRIAGDVLSPRGLQAVASEVTGQKFHLFRAGGLEGLNSLISTTRRMMPKNDEVFPPWQGMQYLHNMLSGHAKLAPLDNDRYPDMPWTPVQEVLASR